MIRKLFLLAVMALAALALTASSALADEDEGVHVENPGTYEVEGEVDLAVVSHSLSGVETPQLRCNTHWDVEVLEDGTGTLATEGGYESHLEPPSTGPCDEVEPCDHETWPVLLEEDEDAVPPTEFRVHSVFCLQGTTLPALPQAVECDVEEDVVTTVHCDAPVYGGALEVQGEVDVHGLLGLMHAS